MGVPTGDGPAGEWRDVVSHRTADHVVLYARDVVALAGSPPDSYTVELLCGGTCRWCRERDVRIAELEAAVRELETRRAYADVGGG